VHAYIAGLEFFVSLTASIIADMTRTW
jgi:hypothetical protein